MLPGAVIYLTAAGTGQVTQSGVCALCFTAWGGGKYKGLKQVIFSICIFQEFVILRSDFTFSMKAIFLTLFCYNFFLVHMNL